MKKTILFLIFSILFFSIADVNAESFTPVFCNDYEFTCCSEVLGASATTTINQDEGIGCSEFASRCEAVGIQMPINYNNVPSGYYIGSGNCRVEDKWYTSPYFICDNERKLTSSTADLKKGEYIYHTYRGIGSSSISLTFKRYDENLYFCGLAGCTQGVTVQGANLCTFVPDSNTIYTTTGSKKTTTSYTVPTKECVLSWQRGNRHICGYKEESCSVDNDCTGHTYGNQECTGRTLQTYGCVSYGTPISERDRLPSESGWGTDESQPSSGNADYGNRCEVVETDKVQCCGDTDCGSNAFCDLNSFTCEEKAECTQDVDCGVSIRCDRETKELKKPVCKNGECDFEVSQNVECCYNSDCPADYLCDTDYTCKAKTTVKSDCPNECCDGSELYFDKPCSDNKVCCGDGLCASDISGCNIPPSTETEPTGECKPIFGLGKMVIIPAFEGVRTVENKILGIKFSESKEACFGTWEIASFILGIIAILIVPFLVYDLFKKRKLFTAKEKAKKTILGIISIIIGLLVYIAVINLLLYGIIVAVVVTVALLLFRKG